MFLKYVFIPMCLSMICLPMPLFADIYKYYDDDGGVNVTNDVTSIPERYRAGVTVVRESELAEKVRLREKQREREERTRSEKQRLSPDMSVAPHTLTAPQAVPQFVPVGNTREKVTADQQYRKLGWLDRQLPLLKVAGLMVLVFSAAVLLARVIGTLMPGTAGRMIGIVLMVGVLVYLFKGYSEKVVNAFAVLKSGTERVQNAVDRRTEKMELQTVDK